MKRSDGRSFAGLGPGLQATVASIEEQVGRVLESDGFRKSHRLADLLRFLVSQTLAGSHDRLKEYVIGTEAFGREPSFDPRTNALVRVEASRLRHRLREYFLGAGRDDPIRIELAAGSYVPRFVGTQPAETQPPALSTAAGPGYAPTPGMSDWPSIAVLPFAFLGEGRRRRFLATGVAEELVATLSATRWLRVIAHSSSLSYTGRRMDVRQLGRETAVSYVLSGSVLCAGDHIRVFVQLVDAVTENVLSAHRHVDVLGDLFLLQGQIARTIAPAIEREIATAERERAARRSTDNLGAWGLYQRGIHHLCRFTFDNNQRARELFVQAAAADPGFASPNGALAYAGFLDYVLGFTDVPEKTVADAVQAGRVAVQRDDDDPMAHFGLARALSLTGALDSAMAELKAAIELNPNFGPAYLGVGAALSLAGRHREAVEALDVAISLSSHDPILWTMENLRALSHLELGHLDKAVEDGRRACRHSNTVPWAYLTLISALSNMDRAEEVHAARTSLFEKWPAFSMSRFAPIPFDIGTAPRWHRGVRKARLEESP